MGKGCSWDILDQNKISNWSIYSLKLNFAILIQIVFRYNKKIIMYHFTFWIVNASYPWLFLADSEANTTLNVLVIHRIVPKFIYSLFFSDKNRDSKHTINMQKHSCISETQLQIIINLTTSEHHQSVWLCATVAHLLVFILMWNLTLMWHASTIWLVHLYNHTFMTSRSF